MDGKHVGMKAPKKSGNLYFNYKRYFSIVLMAVANANYQFLYIDVGGLWRKSDGGFFSNSMIGEAMRKADWQSLSRNPWQLILN